MMRTHRSFRLGHVVLAILWLAIAARAQGPVTRVVVKEATTRSAPASISLVGTLTPARVSRIGAEVPGIVKELPVRQGDRVERGGLLCKLNDDSLSLRLAEERARLGVFESRHEELVAGTRQEDLDALKALLDETSAEYERWKFEMERVEGLYSSADSNAKEYRDTQASFRMVERRRIAAQAAYDKGLAGPRKEAVAGAAHEVAAQRAIVDRLESDLRKTEIRSPFGGFVTHRLTEVGQWLAEGDPVLEVAELDSVLVRVDAPESAYAYLKIDEPVRVTVDALQRAFEGRIKHVIPQADVKARTIPVEIEVDNRDGALAGGMFCRASVPAGPSVNMLAVPKDAIVDREGRSYVGIVTRAEQGGLSGFLIPVTVGVDDGAWIAVTSEGIKSGTAVIVRGNERMLPFPMPVELVDEVGRPIADAVNTVPLEAPTPTIDGMGK